MSATEQIEASDTGPPSLPHYYMGQNPSLRISWLVKDVFPEKSVNLIVGESQAGKSFIALDLAVAIAAGRPFLGHDTTQGGVLYIAAEGAITIPRRLHAALQGSEIDQRLVAVIDAPVDLMQSIDVDRVIAKAREISTEMLEATGHPLAMIIIDTLMYAFTINNWNDAGESAKAMGALKRIAFEVGVATIGVHHHGKDPSRGAAGSYAFTAAADAILSVYKTGEEGAIKDRYVILTKSRFSGPSRKRYFELASLPPDHREEDGDDEAFVRPLLDDVGTAEGSSPKLPTSRGENAFCMAAKTALEQGVEVETDDHGIVTAVPLQQAKDIFLRNYPSKGGKDPNAAAKKAWNRMLERIGDTRYRRGSWDSQEWLYIDGPQRGLVLSYVSLRSTARFAR